MHLITTARDFAHDKTLAYNNSISYSMTFQGQLFQKPSTDGVSPTDTSKAAGYKEINCLGKHQRHQDILAAHLWITNEQNVRYSF